MSLELNSFGFKYQSAIPEQFFRKAINNANDNLATYPQCQAGDVGNDTIVFNVPGTITFVAMAS